ncbi:MAG TPA: 2-amino-4-hydroxy-6-hydroxymethyldihydropteridine diphosphokinase [Fimbriimonadaceae bacterium]|nr:2-amino-4-hydroxy-6-hydroxymethyldihydropteridine diphosphokinase [Fimbriimonadaceae bacterium]
MPTVVIALGSNLGDRIGNMRQAAELMESTIRFTRQARVYETAPMYVTDQPAFLNSALRGETDLGPLGLLRELKRIEVEVGRTPKVRNGPREIDLDLIAYEDLAYHFHGQGESILQLPHPRLGERRFVLQPLSDLGVMRLPKLGALETLLEATESQAKSVVTTEYALLPVHRSG